MSCNADETDAVSVLSQMSQVTQLANHHSENTQHIDGSVIAHECDVETTSNQDITAIDENETLEAGTSVVVALCETGEVNETKIPVQPSFQVEGAAIKMFPCEYCGKVFSKSYNLKTHHRVHSGERPYKCDVCDHNFANLGDLKRHSRIHTGEKPYSCDYCGRSFSDYGSHKRHLRLHTGYKPFKCEQCEREFTRLDSYKNHLRLHTGDRPYKCEECLKEFNYLTTFKRHQNVHSGERPFSCDQCGKTFTRSIYMRNHKRRSCGVEKGRPKARAKEAGNETAVETSTALLSVSKVNDISHGTVMESIAHDLSMQGGVQLNVAKVVYTNGESQQVLFESNETTSHTLILATNPENGQQLLELAAQSLSHDKSSLRADSDPSAENSCTQTVYLTEGLPNCLNEVDDPSSNILQDTNVCDNLKKRVEDLSALEYEETCDLSFDRTNESTYVAVAPAPNFIGDEKD